MHRLLCYTKYHAYVLGIIFVDRENAIGRISMCSSFEKLKYTYYPRSWNVLSVNRGTYPW